ncbi:MAG: hypothetical protein IKL84_06280 [Clostridia bacterium]|nr:hypothetical protein [Clostridia bacterium]
MTNVKLAFTLSELPCYAIAHKNGRKTFEFQAFDGEISCDVQYDYAREPLRLAAKIEENDVIELVLMPHRIELYVNGTIADEEWPMGKRLFALGDAINSTVEVHIEEYAEPSAAEPSVTSTFIMPDGWYPGNGVFVGDCMPYRRDDEYHVLYLKDRHHHKSKWGLGAHQWAHISTRDFKTWQTHPMAVPITDPDEGSICTGSWIREGGREYLFYTLRMRSGVPAPIRRSVSYDGYHFEKDPDFGFTVSEKYCRGSARDPKVIRGADGRFHMFLTTRLLDESRRGCLAHYVSEDLDTWDEVDEPIYVAPGTDQPECPDYFFYGGKYYLIFSLRGRAHYMFSDKPFSDFVMPEDPIIPCSSVPKCAEWQGRLIFAGFRSFRGVGGYAGSITFKAAEADERGLLIFSDI